MFSKKLILVMGAVMLSPIAGAGTIDIVVRDKHKTYNCVYVKDSGTVAGSCTTSVARDFDEPRSVTTDVHVPAKAVNPDGHAVPAPLKKLFEM